MSIEITQMLSQGNILWKGGQFKDAIKIYDKILKLSPGNEDALNCKGLCYKENGESPEAMECFKEALSLNPRDWNAYTNKGDLLKGTDHLQEAIDSYKLATKYGPGNCRAKESLAVALTDLGTELKIKGNVEFGIKAYKEALSHNPTYSPAYFNLGVAYGEKNLLDEALEHYKSAVEHTPNYVEALGNIGVIYKLRQDLRTAVQYYEMALKIKPNFALVLENIAIAYTDLGTQTKSDGKLDESITFYKKALVHNPRYSEAWYNLAVACAAASDLDEAIRCYHVAIMCNPNYAEAYNNLGVIYRDRGNLEKSIECYRHALKSNPQFQLVLNNMSVVYTLMGRWDEAKVHCQKAIEVDPKYAEAYNNLGVQYRDEGRIQEAIQNYEKCLAIDPTSRFAGHNRLLAMNNLANLNDDEVAEDVWQTHKKWGIEFAKGFRKYTEYANDKTWPTTRPIRIGYLCSNFFTHSGAYNIELPLRYANPEVCEVFCYASVAKKDTMTERLKKLVKKENWIDIYGVQTHEVAERIKNDCIDILVELTGHMAGNRLDVMAMKPAPVSATWIGYPNTTGLPTIDYRFTDSIVDPPELMQKYSEQLVRLPGPFLSYSHPLDAPDVGPLPAVRNGFVTFGTFNNMAKVNYRAVGVWCKILQNIPNSRIIIKCKPFTSLTIRNRFMEAFTKEKIALHRVELMAQTPTTREHLELYGKIDIGVDTFPYVGTITTFEALYMGIPVITLRSQKLNCHAHNVGVTILTRLGLKHLIADNEEHYVQTAKKLSSDIESLSQLRASTRRKLLDSSFCDGNTFTKDLESVYQKLWKRYCVGDETVESDEVHQQKESSARPTEARSQRPQIKQKDNNGNIESKKQEDNVTGKKKKEIKKAEKQKTKGKGKKKKKSKTLKAQNNK